MIQDHPVDTDRDLPKVPSREDARALLDALIPLKFHPQAQELWDTVLGPLYDRQQASLDWFRGRCRHCGASHPAVVQPRGRELRTNHSMWCRKYVGPLAHSKSKTELSFYGYKVLCSCGKTYPEWADAEQTIPGNCPDSHLDWRGPRPDAPAHEEGAEDEGDSE